MNLASIIEYELRARLPGKWRESIGAQLYAQYVKLRLRGLQATVERTHHEHEIEYFRVDRGRPDRLIFLPGFADTKENFFDAAQILSQDFDLVVPDLPGFGHSFKKKGETYSLNNYGLWLQEFIEQHVRWTDFHLIGNSLGGAAAIELALRIPDRIKTLTLIDPAGVVLPDLPSIYHEFMSDRNIFELSTPLQFEYFLNRVFYRPPLIPPFVWDHLYQEFARHGRWHRKVLKDLLHGIKSFDDRRVAQVTLNDRLHQIRTPTLLLWGDEDSFFPSETAYFMQQQIPHSQLYILPDRGHSPQVEAPMQCVKIIRKFILQQKRRKTTRSKPRSGEARRKI